MAWSSNSSVHEESHIHVLPCCQWILAAVMQRAWLRWPPDVGPMAHAVLVAPHATRCNINWQRFKPPTHSLPWRSITRRERWTQWARLGCRGVWMVVLHNRYITLVLPWHSSWAQRMPHPPTGQTEAHQNSQTAWSENVKAECLNKAEQLTNCELSRSRLIAAAVETGPSK